MPRKAIRVPRVTIPKFTPTAHTHQADTPLNNPATRRVKFYQGVSKSLATSPKDRAIAAKILNKRR